MDVFYYFPGELNNERNCKAHRISPNVCKVAYVTNRKLRVVDVCPNFYGSQTLSKNEKE